MQSTLAQNADIAANVLGAVGQTPLVQLDRYLDTSNVTLFAKMESFNPGGSAKDRPAKRMIEQALASGEIDDSSTIIESSSGNMGIGLAQVCRFYGLSFTCVVDPFAQKENIEMMRSLGANVDEVTSPLNGDWLSARLARVSRLLEETTNSYWPNQYANEENPASHEHGTIAEIDEALDGQFDYLFVACSSTGTVSGCERYLRDRGRNVTIVAVDAVGSVLFGGRRGARKIPGLGAGKLSELATQVSVDMVQRVSDIDCVIGCRRMAHREAILVGGSAGGVLESVRRLAPTLEGSRCVAILHDSGTRYLNTIFSDEWVRRELGVSPAEIEVRLGSKRGVR